MVQLRRIEIVRINEQVYEAIEAAIVRCELEPGAGLGDRQLAEMLGVSRTPVRDALHRLESSGLVERRGSMGWMVSTFALQDVQELFELRRVFEPLGLERLSENWDEAVVSAPFLKCGTQTYASDASAVWASDPTPRDWLSGFLAAGWRLSSPGRSRSYPQSSVSGEGLSSENTPPENSM
jgi:DNA-binding transcriptional regulator YhcF (GntR family)